MKIKNVKDYLEQAEYYNYDNENFLDFLDSIKFSFDVPFIHIAGTSGKSVVAAALKNIYESNGYKIGIVTSEIVKEIYDGLLEESLKYAGFAEIFEKNFKLINKFELTSYEFILYCLLKQIKENGCDLAILECHMGGYFDPTNIDEDPVLCILNNTGLEHCDELGKTVSEIAYTKAGIIKKDSLVLYNSTDKDVDFVVNEIGKKSKAKLVQIAEFYDYDIVNLDHLEIGYYPFPRFKVNTKALYNRENIACALEAVNLLNDKFPTQNEKIQEGLLKDLGYGYFDIYKRNDKLIILDKANNAYSIEKLCKSLEFSLEDDIENSAIIFAVDYDKNLEKMLSILSRVSRDITLTSYNDENSRDENGFFLFLEDYPYNKDFKDALDALLNKDDIKNIIVTGNEKFVKEFEDYLGE